MPTEHMTLNFNFIGDRLGSCSALVVNPIIDLTGRPVESFLYFVQSPLRLFAFGESPPKASLFSVGATQTCYTLLWPYGKGCG